MSTVVSADWSTASSVKDENVLEKCFLPKKKTWSTMIDYDWLIDWLISKWLEWKVRKNVKTFLGQIDGRGVPFSGAVERGARVTAEMFLLYRIYRVGLAAGQNGALLSPDKSRHGGRGSVGEGACEGQFLPLCCVDLRRGLLLRRTSCAWLICGKCKVSHSNLIFLHDFRKKIQKILSNWRIESKKSF